MKWSEKYATGVKKIDEQHKMLFKMVSDFQETLEEGRGDRVYGGLLESLGVYARSHFGAEEACMLHYRCPAAKRNKEAHGNFLRVLEDVSVRYESAGYSRNDAVSLVKTLEDWLTDHICKIDVELKTFVPLG